LYCTIGRMIWVLIANCSSTDKGIACERICLSYNL